MGFRIVKAEVVAGYPVVDIGKSLGTDITNYDGTATAGGASTITLQLGSSATDDYYNNQTIEITGGTGAGQKRLISDYVGSTRVATVSTAWATNPSSDSTYLFGPGEVTADVDTSEITAIKTQTDKLTFTVPTQLDVNIQYVNDVQVTGVGTSGTPWGPV